MVELLELARENLAVLLRWQFLVVNDFLSDLSVVQVVQVQLVFVAVLTRQDEPVVHVNAVSADVDAYDWLAGHYTSAHVPDEHLCIPTAGNNQVRIILDVLGAHNSVRMAGESSSAADQGVFQLPGLLVVGSNGAIVTCSEELGALRVVVACQERRAGRFRVGCIKHFA